MFPIEDLLYLKAEGSYTEINLVNRKSVIASRNLKFYDTLLNGEEFERIHNSYIINLNYISEYMRNEGFVILNNEHKIPVSRARKKSFIERLKRNFDRLD